MPKKPFALLMGEVVGQGSAFEDAMTDVKSAIRFHIETFGKEVLESEESAPDVFAAEVLV